MSDIAIRVEGLGKQYRIGKTQQYETLRDHITRGVSAPFRKAASLFRRESAERRHANGELFWALKDVSFEVPRGAVVGVIGRNGAGKSTLLKILSRITEPTEGRAEIHGRVGSLLEVGTGFNGELSGRDNIFLNGAILGMRRAEIKRKFDEIVAFAEVEKFIDTAVKFYSSGMYMRLAFAVAAHLEPEILIVDEVLAVGDAQFQKKCLGKMGDVAKEGRTVLFVSHNLTAVSSLCTSAVLLEHGELVLAAETQAVLTRYAEGLTDTTRLKFTRQFDPTEASGSLRIIEASIHNIHGEHQSSFAFGDPLTFRILLDGVAPVLPLQFVIQIHTGTGVPVLHLMNRYTTLYDMKGTVVAECLLQSCPLYPGDYSVSFWIGTSPNSGVDVVRHALTLTMRPGSLVEYGVDLTWRHGLVHCDTAWKVFEDATSDMVKFPVGEKACTNR